MEPFRGILILSIVSGDPYQFTSAVKISGPRLIEARQDLVKLTIVVLGKRFAVPSEDLRTRLEELAASASNLGHEEEALWMANYLKNSRVANSHMLGVEPLKGIEEVIHRGSQ